MTEILFLPFEKTAQPDGVKNILELAREAGVSLQSTCGGKKICGKCKVIVEKSDGPLPPPSDRECEVFGELVDRGYRLACDTILTNGAVVLIPEESRLKRQVILTSDAEHQYPVQLQSNVNQYYVEVAPPVLNSVIADRERLLLALSSAYGIHRPGLDPFVLQKLPHTLRSDRKGITATIRDKREIIDLYAGRQDGLFGMAFDIGTTTVVGYLMDLLTGNKLSVKSAMNPQIAMGDDVITRISFCHEESGGLEKLRSSIVECLNALIVEASSEAGIDPSRIMEATVVGNTAMHHLFVGLDPQYLPIAPYPPVLQESQDYKARDLGIKIGASAYVHLLPLKAGFVGSDTIACVLATGLHKSKIPTLLIDLGTNGEIVLGNKNRMLCCSTAAGPAFEGGHIRWGMRASAGAIERLKIDPVSLDVKWETIDNEAPLGLCGSGIISAIAEMIRTGIILEKGNFSEEIQSPRLRDGEDGTEFVLVRASETATKQDIVITRKDVAELQMARSAVYAGATLLMEQFEGEQVRRILLAGACGNYADPLDACTVDLFPACETAKVIGVGNAAGHGSCLTLLDKNKRKEAERIAGKIEYRELAAASRFQELFVSSMFFTSALDYQDDF
ncbi:MAG: ASKHA domain-containing protein [Desulfobacterales bacterium]|nr:ASKHA domain-containing protein [Desulfobacterales bacterium]